MPLAPISLQICGMSDKNLNTFGPLHLMEEVVTHTHKVRSNGCIIILIID